jgi:CTP synthase (UTP-ammonia lyase)
MYDVFVESDLLAIVATLCGASRQSSDAIRPTTLVFDWKLKPDSDHIIEIAEHPYFVAGQFHPEFRSRPWEPHPLFAGFIKAALAHTAP